ncbi:GNAT family N-acetyltransferase [Sinomonas sp. G460-2]|uniref:GNAT family N-acetyltransferase n=1 Tax=Sinomonas sp. G460-2 TaxID=3393464 RepID=UPI0039EE5DCF
MTDHEHRPEARDKSRPPETTSRTGPVEIRQAVPDDWRLIRSVRLRALAEDAATFSATLADWSGENDREERWRSRLDPAVSITLVAVAGASPVGMASGIPGQSASSIALVSMWVAPDVRGQGVALSLIRGIESWAATRATELELSVMADNAPAFRLYAKAGFTVDQNRKPDGYDSEITMAKSLEQPA